MQQQAAGREGGRAGDVEDKRKAGRAGDVEDKRKAGPATSRTSARQGGPATSLTVLLPADATATTTMPPSLQRPISLGSALSTTASRRRTV